jgi:malate/lactate dehydrogenase
MNHYDGKKLNDSASIDAIVLGEHGDTVFFSKQLSLINGQPFNDFLDDSEIEQCILSAKKAAKEIKMTQQTTISGFSYYAIRIFELLLFEKREAKPVSILLPEFLKKDLNNAEIFLNLYSSNNNHGVEPIEGYLPNEDKMMNLKKSVELILPCIPGRYLSYFLSQRVRKKNTEIFLSAKFVNRG